MLTHLRQGSKGQNMTICAKSSWPEIPNLLWTPALARASFPSSTTWKPYVRVCLDRQPYSWDGDAYARLRSSQQDSQLSSRASARFLPRVLKKRPKPEVEWFPSLGPAPTMQDPLLTFSCTHLGTGYKLLLPKISSLLCSKACPLPVRKTESHRLTACF